MSREGECLGVGIALGVMLTVLALEVSRPEVEYRIKCEEAIEVRYLREAGKEPDRYCKMADLSIVQIVKGTP